MEFKLDTGAQACIIPKHMFVKIPNVQLQKLNVKLVNYNGSKIEVCGMCKLKCTLKNKSVTHSTGFHIVETKASSSSILGLEALLRLDTLVSSSKLYC